MANLSRYTPVDDAFDDLFRGFFMCPVRVGSMPEAPEMRIKMDVKEDDKTYTVHAEIPGVKKEDIHVTIDGNQVAISAEVKQEKEVKEGEKLLRSERYHGKVARAFTLGQEVDDAAAQARYSDGVLELSLPKRAVTQARRLAIG